MHIIKLELELEKPHCENTHMASWQTLVKTPYGPRYILSLAVDEYALKDMLRSHEAVMDRLKVLSFYFNTSDAENVLKQMKKGQ